ncbi:MAG TPA: hypothetical protein VFA35_08315 [Burkholderiaceae bacterium]|nr:hypothetical protein [Burkholderiaceae bacterium]
MTRRLLGFALLCGISFGAVADREHDRIASDRVAADAKLAAQEHACATRFVVASCVEDARTAHREALNKLRQQELQLDEGRRRAAAEARRNAIAEKAQAQQARASEATNDAPRVRVRRAPAAASAAVDRPDAGAAPHRPSASANANGKATAGADRSAVEQRHRESFEARQREAQAHRDAVLRRNAERAAKGKVAAPLPPGGASAPH